MGARVRTSIVDAIRDHGPISFAEFMQISLYGPGGYYERPPVGEEGDFVTSPHVHPIFGRLLANAIRDLHAALGAPMPLRLQEVGGGDGTLARQLLSALGDTRPDYLVVERSAGARDAMSGIAGLRAGAELEPGAHVVLAHELLDNLPFRRVCATSTGPKEMRIGLGGEDGLVEVLTEPDDDIRRAGSRLAPGDQTVVPDGALAFVTDLARALEHGYALIIDYGGVGSPGGEPHGYRRHRTIADLLADPGDTDITVGVDFDLMAERARREGLVAFPSFTQREALETLGFESWAREELERQVELLDRRDGAGAVGTWSGRGRASLLVDPSALGRHRWLLLATPGLPPPRWLPV